MTLRLYRNVVVSDDLIVGEQSDDGGVSWWPFAGMPELMKIGLMWNHGSAEDMRTLWELSDGYGPTGFVPPQGFDWSGIRDSSRREINAMAFVASRWWRKRGGVGWPWEEEQAQATGARRQKALREMDDMGLEIARGR
jgi:hypothetical protein